jgi:hypothetical protein
MSDRIRLCLDHRKLAGILEETSFQRKEKERCVWNKGMFPTVPEERQRYRRKTQDTRKSTRSVRILLALPPLLLLSPAAVFSLLRS